MEIIGFITLHPYWMIAIAIVAEFWPALLAAALGAVALALLSKWRPA